jgi:hypothetical protein
VVETLNQFNARVLGLEQQQLRVEGEEQQLKKLRDRLETRINTLLDRNLGVLNQHNELSHSKCTLLNLKF